MNATVLAFTLFATLPDVHAHDADTLVVGKGGDRFGYQIASGDLDDDGHQDLVVAAPHPSGGNRVYVFLGPIDLANTSVLEAELADIIIEGPGGTETGWAISVGDLIGDGSDDLVVSAPNESSGAGRVHLFEGPLPGGSSLDTANADHSIDGLQNGAYLGWSLTIGDHDGDGFNELGAGACAAGSGVQVGLGEAYLFDLDGFVLPSSTADASATFKGSGQTGCALASADFNGDGADELVIGSYGDAQNSTFSWGGSVAIVYGRPQFALEYNLYTGDALDQDIALITAEANGSNLGYDLASDDLNDDGYEDLILGAPAKRCPANSWGAPCSGWDRRGRTYVVLGGWDAGPGTDRVIAGVSGAASLADTIYESDDLDDRFGIAVDSAGFAGPTFSRFNHPVAPDPMYGPLILVGTGAQVGANEAWALAYNSGARLEVPPLYFCDWDEETNLFNCDLEPEPEDPRQLRVDVGAMLIGGHRFVGDVGQVFGLEVHGADLDADGWGDLVFGATHQLEYEHPAGDGEAVVFQGR